MPRREEDDEGLFEREVADVRPLARRDRVPPATAPPAREIPGEEAEVRRALEDLVQGNVPLDVADTDEFLEGAAPDADRREVRRLRRGDLVVQSHIDLHGLSADEARVAVARFIVSSRRMGRSVVLVVHGRGRNSPGGVSVIKERLKGWLGRSGISRHVLAFCTARPHDGGAGAVYVLLRP